MSYSWSAHSVWPKNAKLWKNIWKLLSLKVNKCRKVFVRVTTNHNTLQRISLYIPQAKVIMILHDWHRYFESKLVNEPWILIIYFLMRREAARKFFKSCIKMVKIHVYFATVVTSEKIYLNWGKPSKKFTSIPKNFPQFP